MTLYPGSGWKNSDPRSGINIPRIRNTARMYSTCESPFPNEEDCDAAGEDDQAADGHYHRQDVERGVHRRQGLLQHQNFELKTAEKKCWGLATTVGNGIVTSRKIKQCSQLDDSSAAKLKRGRIKIQAAGQICGRTEKGPNSLKAAEFFYSAAERC